MDEEKIKAGVLIFVGYILSPLSWWNDLVVNFPIAYLLASIFWKIYPFNFSLYMLLAYWLTNVAGLVMMHKGAMTIVGVGKYEYTKKNLFNTLLISLVYSALMFAAVKFGLLSPVNP